MYYYYIQLWDWLGGWTERLWASAFLSAVPISVSVACGWCVPSWRSQSCSQRRSQPSLGTSFIHVADLFFAAMASQDSHCIYYRGVMKIEFIWRSPTCIVWFGCGVKVSSLHYSWLYPQFQSWDRNVQLNLESVGGENSVNVKWKKKRRWLREGQFLFIYFSFAGLLKWEVQLRVELRKRNLSFLLLKCWTSTWNISLQSCTCHLIFI